jgi:hypothetical protein
MLGRISCLRMTDRERISIGALLAAAIGVLTLLAAVPAHASGCTDSWTNNKGGSWFTAGNGLRIILIYIVRNGIRDRRNAWWPCC